MVFVIEEEDRRGGVGDGEERFPSGEAGEGGGGETHGTKVVGVGGGEELARVHCLFHEAAALLAPSDGVFVLDPRRCAPHWSRVGWYEELGVRRNGNMGKVTGIQTSGFKKGG